MRRIILLPAPNNGQGKLFPDIEDMPIIVKELKDAGIGARDAWEIYQQGFGYVQENERPIHARVRTKEAAFVEVCPRKNPSAQAPPGLTAGSKTARAFCCRRLSTTGANPGFVEAQKWQVIEEQKKIRQQRQPEIKEVKRQLDETKKYAR